MGSAWLGPYNAGWRSGLSRLPHTEKIEGSNPSPATKKETMKNTKNRIKFAKWLLFGSIVGMIVNVGLYLFKIIGETELILVTLILSWLAITLTALDILATADVRDKQ